MHSAAYHGRIDATEVLIDAGASLMAVNVVSGYVYNSIHSHVEFTLYVSHDTYYYVQFIYICTCTVKINE